MTTLWISNRQWEFAETARNVTAARPKGSKEWWMTSCIPGDGSWNRFAELVDKIRLIGTKSCEP